jgi:hypothetical protein
MSDETTYLRGKWRCSQCGSLNSMARDNVCQKCFDLALDEDEEKIDALMSSEKGSGND